MLMTYDTVIFYNYKGVSTKSPGMAVLENGAELLTWEHVFVFVMCLETKLRSL